MFYYEFFLAVWKDNYKIFLNVPLTGLHLQLDIMVIQVINWKVFVKVCSMYFLLALYLLWICCKYLESFPMIKVSWSQCSYWFLWCSVYRFCSWSCCGIAYFCCLYFTIFRVITHASARRFLRFFVELLEVQSYILLACHCILNYLIYSICRGFGYFLENKSKIELLINLYL